MGDGPSPESEDVHSSRVEDCEPMRMTLLKFCTLHPNQFEKDQAWLEEDQAQAETWYPTQCIRYVEIIQGISKMRYLWMSSRPIRLKRLLLILFPTSQPAFVYTILLPKLSDTLGSSNTNCGSNLAGGEA